MEHRGGRGARERAWVQLLRRRRPPPLPTTRRLTRPCSCAPRCAAQGARRTTTRATGRASCARSRSSCCGRSAGRRSRRASTAWACSSCRSTTSTPPRRACSWSSASSPRVRRPPCVRARLLVSWPARSSLVAAAPALAAPPLTSAACVGAVRRREGGGLPRRAGEQRGGGPLRRGDAAAHRAGAGVFGGRRDGRRAGPRAVPGAQGVGERGRAAARGAGERLRRRVLRGGGVRVVPVAVRVLAAHAQGGVQGHAAQRGAWRVLPGPAERGLQDLLGGVPPALLHQHHAQVAAGAALPDAGAQRGDQHGAGQPQLALRRRGHATASQLGGEGRGALPRG
eukprot:scaffold1690_cov366-Prasinococcus_capsulatus_cf.AAC.10